MKFDGKAYVSAIEHELREKVAKLERAPRAISIVVGDDPASECYSQLKQAAAKRVGIKFDVVKLNLKSQISNLKSEIARIGSRDDVDGVMVQLPVPGIHGLTLRGVLKEIPLTKDMDGLRWERSGVTPATVRAILVILESISLNSQFAIRNSKVVVVGAKGSVGRPLVVKLKERRAEVIELDLGDDLNQAREGEVVISCTGQAGLITPEMISAGKIVVDVGAPKAEFTSEVYEKASVYVPSPGGVGPVTIVSLLQNLLDLSTR